jgi:tetratricopeptide (TPR) repeat protein
MVKRHTVTALVAALLSIPATSTAQAGRAAFDEGQRLLQRGDYAKAEQQFSRAIAADASVAEFHLALGQAVGLQTADAATIRQPFLARRVKASLERAAALDPTLIAAREGLIQFHLNAPAVMGGSVAKARDEARAIAGLDVSRGHLAAATIAWHARDTVATERALRAAITAAPDSLGPVLALVNRQISWQRPSAAWATLDAYAARRPNPLVEYHIGRLAGVTGQQLDRGEGALRGLLAEPAAASTGVPSPATLHARLGDVLRRNGRSAQARASYEQALRLEPGNRLATEGLRALR